MASCKLEECPDEATHMVIYNPVGRERSTEYYCEIHADMAAEEAENDRAGDLFYGPAEIE